MNRDASARRLLRDQLGAITRSQALDLGFSPSSIDPRVQAGTWRPLFRGVYADVAVAPSWEQRALGACLAGGDGTVLSHRSAARLAKLDGCEAPRIEVTSARLIRLPGVVAHRKSLAPWEKTTIAGIPSTSVSRTLVDLAAVVDEVALERALDAAVRKGYVSIDYLVRCVERHRPRPAGAAALLRLLERRGIGQKVTESDLELLFLRLVRGAGLPIPISQYEVWGPQGFIARTDFAYPDQRIAIECDSYRWHHGRIDWQRDLRRGNELALAGWRVIRITYWDLIERPDEIVREISAALGINSLF